MKLLFCLTFHLQLKTGMHRISQLKIGPHRISQLKTGTGKTETDMIKLIIKFNMHLAVESLAGKENKKLVGNLSKFFGILLYILVVHSLKILPIFFSSNSGFWLQKSGFLFGLSVPLPNPMCLLLELLIWSLFTLWKGCENISNDGHSQYCDWPSMETISQPSTVLTDCLSSSSILRNICP